MNLEQLLLTRQLVKKVSTTDQILERANLVKPGPVKLFYGETYDEKGPPVDSMKYYFFVSNLAEALQKEGINVDPIILIADTAACRNAEKDKEKYTMVLGEERLRFVQDVNEIYNAGLHLLRMSDFIESSEFTERRRELMEICRGNSEFMEAIEKTVPDSQVIIERKNNFRYSFDEITTIIDLDVKIGPPRENLYDDVARKIAREKEQKELISLFLTPTFPLGLSWAYFFINNEIEGNGITAYKAGSKKLHRNRIIVGNSSPEFARDLIQNSFISINPSLPNPVLDLGIISEMAQRRLESDDSPITLADDFYVGKITASQLKEKVGSDVEKYILSKFYY